MPTFNVAVATKGNRASQANSALSTAGYVLFYKTSTVPGSPDNTVPSADLLASLPLSNPAGAISYSVVSATVKAGGSGGTNGTQTVTGTTGTGTKFQASVTVSSGAITAVNSITTVGTYSALPTNLDAEPVTGASLSGATLSLNMTAALVFNAITTSNASATGTATFARFAAANTAGAAGVVDLDVGTSGTSVIINSTSIVSGGPVVVSSATFTEA